MALFCVSLVSLMCGGDSLCWHRDRSRCREECRDRRVRHAFGHLKVVGHTGAAQPLFAKAGLADDLDEGVVELDARASIAQYIKAAKQQRVWDREARLAEGDA